MENPLTFNQNVLEYIDSLQDVEEAKATAELLDNSKLKKVFWDCYKKYLKEKSELEKRKILLKCGYINRYFGSNIPISKNISPFITPHDFYGIFISSAAKVGKGCIIFQGVTIGSNTLLDSKSAGAPTIGDNAYIGAGAKIIGNVKVGNNVRIGAGCTVTRDVPDNSTVAQGKPFVFEKSTPQNNRWVTIQDWRKLKAEEKAQQDSAPANFNPPTINLFDVQDKDIYRVADATTLKSYENAFRILFCGDLILLEDQVKRAFDGQRYDFDDMFEFTRKYISAADFSIGVFEGPLGGDSNSYSQSNYGDGKKLRLNFPDEFVDAIKNAGFDLVTTATNHILDMKLAGLSRTIDVLREKKLDFIGTYKSAEDKESSRVKLIEKGGIKFAVLAYTYGTNRFSNGRILSEESLTHITSLTARRDIPEFEDVLAAVKKDFELAKSYNPDLIIVLPHWGSQFTDQPNSNQRYWRKTFIELGADIILGDHTHSVQPAKIETVDGRKTFTLYSPGNYANIYREHDGDASLMVEVYIDRETKKILGGAIIPMWTRATLSGNYRPLPIYKILTDEKLGREISTFELERVSYVLKHITQVALGTELNENLIQERYFFDEEGFQRKKVEPLTISDELIKGKFFTAIQAAQNVCFVGDSVTLGSKNGGVPWYEPIAPFIKGTIFNASFNGATLKRLISEEFLSKIAAAPADLFVIAIGTNDVRYRNEKICAMTPREYIDCLKVLRGEILKNTPAAKFIFIAPWTSTDGDKFCSMKYGDKVKMNNQYTDALKVFCEVTGDIFINANAHIDSILNVRPHRDYLKDWIHPNANRGVQLYSEAVLKS